MIYANFEVLFEANADDGDKLKKKKKKTPYRSGSYYDLIEAG